MREREEKRFDCSAGANALRKFNAEKEIQQSTIAQAPELITETRVRWTEVMNTYCYLLKNGKSNADEQVNRSV